MSTDPLFDLVTPPADRPVLLTPRFGAADAKWTSWKGAHRACDDCVQRVHERGMEHAPPPFPAQWRRKGPNGDGWFCVVDADERKALDAAATEARDAGVAHREHLAKARRSRVD